MASLTTEVADTVLRQHLIAIDEELGKDELDALKFLCFDFIPACDLETATSALDIFRHMMRSCKNLDFILECLGRMHRYDLVKKIGFDPEELRNKVSTMENVSPYRRFLLELSDDIDSEDVDKLKRRLDGRIKKKKLSEATNIYKVFISLEQEGIISPEKTQPLVDLLRSIHREDLVKIVEDFEVRRARPRDLDRNNSYHDRHLERISALMQSLSISLHVNAQQIVETVVDQLQTGVQVETSGDDSVDNGESLQGLPEYTMDKNPRGWCVIINNREFTHGANDPTAREMGIRNGTDKDAERLSNIFEKLGFIVHQRDNLSDTEILRYLIYIAHNVDHSNFNSLVVCILTHGMENHVFGTNGRPVSIREIVSLFQRDRCPALAGKPKLFFLQACQGGKFMEGHEVQTDVIARDPNDEVDINISNSQILSEEDFLIGYATLPGYACFRHPSLGSWYIQILCDMLEKHSARYSLLPVLVKVNEKICEEKAKVEGGIYKQVSAILVTLTKQLYFR